MGEKMDSEREAFEKWADDNNMNTSILYGEYVNDTTDSAWSAWQARAHLTQPAQAVDGWQLTDDDVRAWRGRHNVSLSLYDCRSAIEDARIMHHFDVRPAALPKANGKEDTDAAR